MLGTVFCIGTCGKESAGFVATGLGGGSERFEGPKLKDYLPFMKPKTFGKGRVNTGSLPSSLMSSPVHLPPSPGFVATGLGGGSESTSLLIY
jgi:hypothetical protein